MIMLLFLLPRSIPALVATAATSFVASPTFSSTTSSFCHQRVVLSRTTNILQSFLSRRLSSSSSSHRTLSSTSSVSSSSTYGQGLDQYELMESDNLIVVHPNDDSILGQCSKRQGHTFFSSPDIAADTASSSNSLSQQQQQQNFQFGICHRAFSLFMFVNDDDDDNNNGNGNTKEKTKKKKMLLTQRAATKLTFPNVWTNACCSHPLWNQIPNEVDDHEQQQASKHTHEKQTNYNDFVNGIKHAAIRKVQHELGYTIPSIQDITFLTRFYYYASNNNINNDNSVSSSSSNQWGEHEIDYVLLYQLPKHTTGDDDPFYKNLFHFHPEEVSNYQFVTRDELNQLFMDSDQQQQQQQQHSSSSHRRTWSPWFRGIMNHPEWDTWFWNNTDFTNTTMTGKYTTWDIHRLSSPLPDQEMAMYDTYTTAAANSLGATDTTISTTTTQC